MTSYPKDVNRFRKWAQAMVEGATVDKPNYGKALAGPRKPKRLRRRRKLKRKKKNALQQET